MSVFFSILELFKHTSTVLIAICDDGRGNVGATSCVGAVTNTVTEVDVMAKTGSIARSASKGWSQGEHVVDAGLLCDVMLAKDHNAKIRVAQPLNICGRVLVQKEGLGEGLNLSGAVQNG